MLCTEGGCRLYCQFLPTAFQRQQKHVGCIRWCNSKPVSNKKNIYGSKTVCIQRRESLICISVKLQDGYYKGSFKMYFIIHVRKIPRICTVILSLVQEEPVAPLKLDSASLLSYIYDIISINPLQYFLLQSCFITNCPICLFMTQICPYYLSGVENWPFGLKQHHKTKSPHTVKLRICVQQKCVWTEAQNCTSQYYGNICSNCKC